MTNRNRRKPSPATVIALLALVFSMAGTATAARVLITSSSQIKANAVTGSDIKNGSVARGDLKADAVNADKIRNGSLGSEELSSEARAALGAEALEAFRKAGPTGVERATSARVATLSNIPAGTYAIFAKTIITPDKPESGFFREGEGIAGHCTLDASGDRDDGRALLGSPGALAPATVTMQITRTFGSAGTAALDCDVNVSKWRASDTSIIAVRVGKTSRSPVEG